MVLCIHANVVRSRKSYADRLATRTSESRKRKRNAARKAAGEPVTPRLVAAKRLGAARSGRQQVPHDEVRVFISEAANSLAPKLTSFAASSAGTKASKAPRGKRARKTAATGRRASSATTSSPGINHYDNSGLDLGEGFSTMAWEGVGSAGYH